MATIPASENEYPEVLFTEGAAPAAPAAGLVKVYAKSDGLLYWKDDANTEYAVSSGDFAAHLADATDAHDASAVSVDPTGLTVVTGTELQTAVEELDAAVGTSGAGAIVQVKTAVLSSDFTTTAATMQDSGLSLAFTPLFADSILHINVDGEASFQRVAGTIDGRYGWVEIYNSTDAVAVKTEIRGQILVAASAVASNQVPPIALKGTYTVNSTAARTFKLRTMAGVVTNIQAQITGSRTGGVIMTIMEVRP